MYRAYVILFALLLNVALAGPRRWYDALGLLRAGRLPAQALRKIERKLNREHRSDAERRQRGWSLTIAVMLIAVLLGIMADWLCRADALHFLELGIVALALPVRPVWDLAAFMQKKLEQGELNEARKCLSDGAWRHAAALDAFGLCRATIETIAVGFSERIVAPALWYLLLGLPGLFISKAIWLLRETLARPGQIDHAFTQGAQAVHYVLHYIPSRVAALLWMAAAVFFPGVKLREACRSIARAFPAAPPQYLALLGMAALLDISLGGPPSLYADGAWAGGGTARPEPLYIRRALHLFGVLHLLLFLAIGLIFR